MDPTGHAKVTPDDISLPDYEINILSPIRGTYQNNHLFYFPEAYFCSFLDTGKRLPLLRSSQSDDLCLDFHDVSEKLIPL
jgi:hypothetical protein